MTETTTANTDLSRAAAAANLGYWHNRDGRFHFDPAAQALLAASAMVLTEGEFLDLVHELDRSPVRMELQARLYAGAEHDVDFRRIDGRWLRMRGRLLADEEGARRGFFWTSADGAPSSIP